MRAVETGASRFETFVLWLWAASDIRTMCKTAIARRGGPAPLLQEGGRWHGGLQRAMLRADVIPRHGRDEQ